MATATMERSRKVLRSSTLQTCFSPAFLFRPDLRRSRLLWGLLIFCLMIVASAALAPQKAFARGGGIDGYADRPAVQSVDANELACYNCHGSEDGSTTHPDSGAFIPLVQIVSGPSSLAPGAIGTYTLRATKGASSAATYAGLNITVINQAWSMATRSNTLAGTLAIPAAESSWLRLTDGTDNVSYQTLRKVGDITHSQFKNLTGNSVEWTFTWTAPSTSGTYEIWAIANLLEARNSTKNNWIDQNTGATGSQPFVVSVIPVDGTAPNAPSITYPTSNSTLSDSPTVNVQGTASDNAGGSGINWVGVVIQRSSDSWYWNQPTATWQSGRYENTASVDTPLAETTGWSFAWQRPTQDGGAPTYTIRALARDAAGNVGPDSGPVSNITIDNVAPSGSFTVNNDAAYTNSTTVTINSSVSGATQMRFSNDGLFDTEPWEAYNAVRTNWTLPVLDGTKTVYGQYRDAALNTSGTLTDQIALDTAAPTVTVVSPAEGATGVAVNANVSGTFSETTIDQTTLVDANVYLTIQGNPTHVPSVITYDGANGIVTLNPNADLNPTTIYQATITTGVRDLAGNPLATQKQWTFTTAAGADSTPPDVPSISYPTSNSTLTDSPTVNVTGSASDPAGGTGISRVAVIIRRSSDNNYWNQTTQTWQATEAENDAGGFTAGQASVNWSFSWQRPSQDGGSPTYSILARAYDGANNSTDSALVSNITIDNVSPAGTIALNDGATATNTTSVTINNSISGATQMRFAHTQGDLASASWEPYAATKPWTLQSGDGTKTVWGEFRDGAGNSYQTSDTIVLDTSGLSGTISIENGATYTTSGTVTINNSVTGATEMRFSNDGVFDTELWEAYSSIKSNWALTPGDGTKTVWGQFRNAAQTTYTASDSIILDATPPGVPQDLVVTFTRPYSIGLGWTAVAGAASYQIFDGAIQVGTSATNSFIHRGLAPNTSHTYTVKSVDELGNASTASASVAASTSPEPTIAPIGGWWTEYGRNSGDPSDTRALAPTGGDLFSPNTPAGGPTPSPHGDFSASTNKCKTCHAVHRANDNSFRLLHDISRQTECNWCHDATTGRSSHRPYGEMVLRGYTVRGEHTLGANRIPDSKVNDTAFGDPADDGWGRLPDLGDGVTPPGLNCYYCHSVHGANTFYRTSDPATLLAGEKRWRASIIRNDPAGNGNPGVIVDFSGTQQTYGSGSLSYTKAYFCGDCHNKNPNFGDDAQTNQGWNDTDNDGVKDVGETLHSSRPNPASHPTRGDGWVEIYGNTGQTGATQVSTGLSDCTSCHMATTFTSGPKPGAGAGGPSDFPHQSLGHKLLEDSYVDTDLAGVTTAGDPQRPLPATDQICLGCHDIGPGEGVGKTF